MIEAPASTLPAVSSSYSPQLPRLQPQSEAAHALDPRDPVWCHLALWSLYPLFLFTELWRRSISRTSESAHGNRAPGRSAFAEAREQASIVISHAFMARSMWQQFGRHSRPERRS